jgi:acetyltransferase-like isoleucine patch superfamily enzyme
MTTGSRADTLFPSSSLAYNLTLSSIHSDKAPRMTIDKNIPHSTKTDPEKYRRQHQLRLSYMPWLYARLKPGHRVWAEAWQAEWQAYLMEMETIVIGKNCFIAPEARLFAEPGRTIVIGDNSVIAADAVLHGPITIGSNVSINHHVTLDGGSKGIVIGDDTRLAAYCHLYAFNHGMAPDRPISEQPVTSKGITLGKDVWLGAHVGVVDGVTIADHAIVGMASVVTHHVDAFAIVAGNPARVIGDRRNK